MGFDYSESIAEPEVNHSVGFDESTYFSHDRVRIHGMFVDVVEHDQVDRPVGKGQGVTVTLGEGDSRAKSSVGVRQPGRVDIDPRNQPAFPPAFLRYLPRPAPAIHGSAP